MELMNKLNVADFRIFDLESVDFEGLLAKLGNSKVIVSTINLFILERSSYDFK